MKSWPKVKLGHKVNWNTIYDLLYVFHVNLVTIQKIQPIKSTIIIDFTYKGHPRSKVMRSNKIPYMT